MLVGEERVLDSDLALTHIEVHLIKGNVTIKKVGILSLWVPMSKQN